MTRCNAELANSFGNLAQRTLSMIFKNLDGILRTDFEIHDDDRLLFFKLQTGIGNMHGLFESKLAFSDGLDRWMGAVFACNQYIDEQAPWALRKTDPERMAAVLMTLFQCVRDLAIAVRCIVPTSIENLLDQMGIPTVERDFAALNDADWFARLASSGYTVAQPIGVFPRLEIPAEEVSQ